MVKVKKHVYYGNALKKHIDSFFEEWEKKPKTSENEVERIKKLT